MDYKPQSQNIFSYLGDLRKAIKRLNDINERLPDTGLIILPDSYIRAARQVPIYKPVLDAILISDITTWSAMTSEELYHKLEAVCANDQSVQSQQTYSAPTYDSVTANAIQAYTRQEKSAENKKPTVLPKATVQEIHVVSRMLCHLNIDKLKRKLKSNRNKHKKMHTPRTNVIDAARKSTLLKNASLMGNVDIVGEWGTWKVYAMQRRLANLEYYSLQWMAAIFMQTCCVYLCLLLQKKKWLCLTQKPPPPPPKRCT